MTRAYIGLGSNLDDPELHITQAFADIEAIPNTQQQARSSLYVTEPVGPRDQPDFINAVSCVQTLLEAPELLCHLQAIEKAHGRVRTGKHWGPRTLDLDLLLYADAEIDLPELKVPHPELHRRCFVLRPLVEIAPEIIVPSLGAAKTLLESIDCRGVRKFVHA